MMRALEENLAEWARRQVAALAAQSKLFGTLRTVPADQTNLPALQATETGLQAIVLELQPTNPGPEVGPDAGVGEHLLQFTARALLRCFGTDKPLADGDAGSIQPCVAHSHRVDVVLLSLLSLLRERQHPAPDGAVSAAPASLLGETPGGAFVASEGARTVRLDWQVTGTGPAVPHTEGGRRLWELPLTAICVFRLSPLALEGGRILQVDAVVARRGGTPGQMELAVYAPARAITLDHFAGLGNTVLIELSSRDVFTLGDLDRLGTAGVVGLAAGLRSATPAERSVLGGLAGINEARHEYGGVFAGTWLNPALLALPARALLAPTTAEQAVIDQAGLPAEITAAITAVAVPAASALRPEYRETVAVGTLVVQGR